MKNEKQNIGLAVLPYVEGCFHSTSTLACCFIPTYAKSGVRHLYIMGVYSNGSAHRDKRLGVRHLYNMGVTATDHRHVVLDTCTLIKKILVIVVISKNSSIFAIKTDKNFIKS